MRLTSNPALAGYGALDAHPLVGAVQRAALRGAVRSRPALVAAAAANTDNKVSLGQISKKLAQLWKETNDRNTNLVIICFSFSFK